jgi:hypothetical protein
MPSVLRPGDHGWDQARLAFNLAVDQRPAAIAKVRSLDDVVDAVHMAREEKLRAAPQGAGHGAGPLGDLSDTLLIRTEAMKGAEVDVEAQRARVQGGARWRDLVPAAAEHRLAALHGSSPTVGIVGYSLGGGLGWYARKHGLQSNRLTAAEVVTADGELRRVDAGSDSELFWAMRGGGGSFGIVTALEFEVLPIEQVYAGVLFFPFERSPEVLHAWREWTMGAPDEVTSLGRLLQFPPAEQIPESMRGNSFAVVEAAYLGDEADGAELIRPLRDLGPTMDTFEMMPPHALGALHMDPPEPVPGLSATQCLGDLPGRAIDDLMPLAGPGSESLLVSLELRQLGGALARQDGDSGVRGTLPGAFIMYAVGSLMDPAVRPGLEAQLEAIKGALAPYAVPDFFNFVDGVVDSASLFDEDVFRRLREVKSRYDPDDLIRANHEVPPN